MMTKTIVTACDHKFVWGAMLLGLSLRYHGLMCPYHILGYDLLKSDIACLEGLPNTKVFNSHKASVRSVCTQKPMAIATADTDLIIWMDADCMVSGNVDDYLICPEGKFQIRFREKAENASVYRNYYQQGDAWGSIPSRVLRKWKDDIADKDLPAIETVCQTNCFVLSRQHLPFISLWQKQMEKVIPESTKGVYAKDSYAYSMTDESVLNSLFAFSSAAPQTTEYLMDKDPAAICIHFGLNPKPWNHWTRQAFMVYNDVQNLLKWAKKEGLKLPPIPPSFDPINKNMEFRRACAIGTYRDLRYQLSTFVRKGIRGIL